MTDVQSMIVRLVGDAGNYQKMLTDAVAQTKAAASQIEQHTSTIANSFKNAIGGIGELSIGEFAKFDKGITESVAKLGGATPEVRKRMEDIAKALSISGEVSFAPAELAKAYEEMAGAGLGAERSMASLATVAKTAQSGIMSVGMATKGLSSAMFAFGLASQNANEFAANMKKVSDIAVMADDLNPTRTQSVLKAMAGDGARAAREWGMSLEEMVAALSVYARSSIEGAEASNLLGRAIRLTSTSYATHKAIWNKEGLNLVDETTGKWIKFSDAMDMLSTRMKNLRGPDKTLFLNSLGLKVLSQKAILPFLGAPGVQKELSETYLGATDRVNKKSAIQMTAFLSQMKLLKNELIVLAIDIGTILEPSITAVVDQVKELTSWFRNMSDESKQYVVLAGASVFGAAAAFLGLVVAVKAANVVFGIFTGILGLLPIQLFLNVAAWTAYYAVVYTASAAVAVYTATLAVLEAVHFNLTVGIVGQTAAWVVLKATVFLMSAATTAYNAAMTVLTTNLVIQKAVLIGQTVAWVAVKVAIGVATAATASYNAAVTVLTTGWLIQKAALVGTWVMIGVATVAILAYRAAVLATTVPMAIYNGLLVVWRAVVIAATAVKWLFTAAVLAAKAALTLNTLAVVALKGVMLLLSGAVVIVKAAFLAFSATMLIVNGTVWLLSAAFTAFFAIVTPAAIMATVVTVGVLGAAFVVIAAAVYGAYKAVQEFFTSFASAKNFAGPIAHVGELFKEWGTILSDVFTISQVSMPIAWELLVAGGKLAVIQLQLLWPPLWEVIKVGADSAAKLAGISFKREFSAAMVYMIDKVRTVGGKIPGMLSSVLFPLGSIAGGLFEDTKKQTEEFDKEAEKIEERMKKFSVPGSGEQDAARDEIKAITARGMEAIAERDRLAKLAEGKSKEDTDRLQQQQEDEWEHWSPNKKMHAQINIDQALFGSQEAFRRIERQADMINEIFEGHTPKEDKKVESAKKVTNELEKQANILQEMADSYAEIMEYLEAEADFDKRLMEGGVRPPVDGIDTNNDPLNPRNSSGVEVAGLLGEMRDYLKKLSENPVIEVEEVGV